MESLAYIQHKKYLDTVWKTKIKGNPATLPSSSIAAFARSLRVYMQMKTRKNSDEKETENTKSGWEAKNGMCYPVMADKLPVPDRILKFIRCNCKTGTDAVHKKRCSCRKNRLFCVMICSQYQAEEYSNKSKSSIIDDIDKDNDRNVFDAFPSF